MAIRTNILYRWMAVIVMLVLAVPALGNSPARAAAQNDCRAFSETGGKRVCGQFLTYWLNNGGLAQQGYPISDEMQERSDTDGKTYTVQYFERAVFEMHPELTSVNKVLLQLLGVFSFNQKYPGGAPGQQPNTSAGSVQFPQTGKRIGGIFLTYWQQHGGLAQQGYPISDEFNEVSIIDGKTYRVQYFERAVFEYHPENAAPYNVLLSQLGKFRYDQKRAGGQQPPQQGGQNPPQQGGGVQTACGTLPANVNAATDVPQIRAGQKIRFAFVGFRPAEPISYWYTLPTGDVIGTERPITAKEAEWIEGDFTPGDRGQIGPITLNTTDDFADFPGIWAITYQGARSGNVAIAYFCLVP